MADEVIIKPSGEWVYKGDESRLKNFRADHQVMGRMGQMMDKVWCLSCGKDGGYALKTSLFIIYQCADCAERYGSLPLPRMPEAEEIQYRNGRTD